jgi:hypothetical protein
MKSLALSVSLALIILACSAMPAMAVDLGWTRVGTDGFGQATNYEIAKLIVFKGQLYAGATNFDSGAEVWRSADGVNWNTVMPNLSMTAGFGNGSASYKIGAMCVFGEYLYVSVNHAPEYLNGCEIWRTSDGESWENVVGTGTGYQSGGFGRINPTFGDVVYTDIYAMSVYNGRLCAGTTTDYASIGAAVYSSADGVTWAPDYERAYNETGGYDSMLTAFGQLSGGLFVGLTNYSPVNGRIIKTTDRINWPYVVGPAPAPTSDGFGEPGDNGWMRAMETFKGNLYVGTYRFGHGTTWTQLWRSPDGNTWAQAGSDGYGAANSVFTNDLMNDGADRYLLAGTGYFVEEEVAYGDNAGVFASANGAAWTQINLPGFANADNTDVLSLVKFGNYIYASTGTIIYSSAKQKEVGGEVWRLPEASILNALGIIDDQAELPYTGR